MGQGQVLRGSRSPSGLKLWQVGSHKGQVASFPFLGPHKVDFIMIDNISRTQTVPSHAGLIKSNKMHSLLSD